MKSERWLLSGLIHKSISDRKQELKNRSSKTTALLNIFTTYCVLVSLAVGLLVIEAEERDPFCPVPFLSSNQQLDHDNSSKLQILYFTLILTIESGMGYVYTIKVVGWNRVYKAVTTHRLRHEPSCSLKLFIFVY